MITASRLMLAAVYRGKKPQFPNYSMFLIDHKKAPFSDGEKARLQLADIGLLDENSGIRGVNFPYGATGMISLGDGYFYFSQDFRNEQGFGSEVCLYRFDATTGRFDQV